MRIKWLAHFGWNTTAENNYEDIAICLMERQIAIKYWRQSLKDKTIKLKREDNNGKS